MFHPRGLCLLYALCAMQAALTFALVKCMSMQCSDRGGVCTDAPPHCLSPRPTRATFDPGKVEAAGAKGTQMGCNWICMYMCIFHAHLRHPEQGQPRRQPQSLQGLPLPDRAVPSAPRVSTGLGRRGRPRLSHSVPVGIRWRLGTRSVRTSANALNLNRQRGKPSSRRQCV